MPNLTIRIDDKELIRRAKVLAVENNTSLSAIVRKYLIDFVNRNDNYELARKRALKNMRRGLRLGGRPLSRDEIYDGRVG